MVSTYVEAFVITPAEKASSEEEKKRLKKKDSEAGDEDDYSLYEEEKVVPFKSGLKASKLSVVVLAKILSYCDLGTFKNIYKTEHVFFEDARGHYLWLETLMQASYKANLENVKIWDEDATSQTIMLTESEQQTLLQFDVDKFAAAIIGLW